MGYYKEFYWSETAARGAWPRRGYDLIKVFQRLCAEEGPVRRWAQVPAGGDQAAGRVRLWYVLKVEPSGLANGLPVDVREVGACLGEGEGSIWPGRASHGVGKALKGVGRGMRAVRGGQSWPGRG